MRLIFNLPKIMRKYCSLSYHLRFGLLSLLLVCFNCVLVTTHVIHSPSKWNKTGCHIVGHTQKFSIPGCVEFELTSNACRGYCTSFSVPSNEEVLKRNPNQLITSCAQCCSIVESEMIHVRAMCMRGPQEFRFKSAVKCDCSPCKKY